MADNNTNAIAKTDVSASERFTNMIVKEFAHGTSLEANLSDVQKRIVGGYFISIDKALKAAEEKRDQTKNNLPMTWNNVNMQSLATDLVHYARLGLDMTQDNMLFPIPYRNNKTGKYDITLMEGYNGRRYIAEKYALDPPRDIRVELVYETDVFRPIVKSATNKVENYEFEITNAFNRGKVVGGFAYLEFTDPAKNKLIIMTIEDIEKRKPKYAAPQFWNDWKNEMYKKTIMREACSSKYIVVDPAKIDDNYQYLKAREAKFAEAEAQAEIDENANRIVMDIPDDANASSTPEELPFV